MTMMSAAHPDPEQLSALAGGDADATADRDLTSHVSSCAACGRQVRDLSALRSALSELPDLTPSRPLQLVPPVAAPAASEWRIAVRRAFAPMAVAGMVLLLVGGIGATGALGPADAQSLLSFRAANPAPAAEHPVTMTDEGAGAPEASIPADNGEMGALGPTPASTPLVGTLDGAGEDDPDTARGEDLGAVSEPTSGWIVLAVVGLGLLVLAFALRAVAPRRTSLGR